MTNLRKRPNVGRRALIPLTAAAVLLSVQATEAADVTARTCSQGDVQAAINSAVSGDRVVVPAGNCVWSRTVSITGKRLQLVGAGVGMTNITDSVGAGSPGALSIVASARDFVDVSGFTFIKGIANSFGMVQITGAKGEFTFRVHHSRFFDNGVAGGRGIFVFSAYGLIDHVAFDVVDTTASDQMVSIMGTPANGDGGFWPWTQPLDLGSSKAVFIEDCTFTAANQNEDIVDGYSGARVVVRRNVFNDTSIGFHGTDSNGSRGPVLVEQYANTFTNNSPVTRRATTNRSGTAMYFDNTFTGTKPWVGFTIVYYRATYAISGGWDFGMCDGVAKDIGSPVITSDASRDAAPYGTAARFLASNPDIVCAGPATGDCTRAIDGPGTRGYPCRDQPGRGPNGQVLAPLYQWNNTGGVTIGVHDTGCTACGGFPATTWFAENRDYYNYIPSGFNGTVGVGRGPAAARPATCTPGVAYWVTDEGEWNSLRPGADGRLYKCTAPNTWTLSYTPFTYPHPLTLAGPEPASNLIIR